MSSTTQHTKHLIEGLTAALMAPEPVDWRVFYTPEVAEELAAELADLDHELDEQHPGWRKHESYHTLPDEKRAWIGHRLKRRHHIVRGNADWGVVVVPGKKGKPLPISIPPGGERRNPGAYAPVISIVSMARKLGSGVEQVRSALPDVAPGTRGVYRAVADILRRRGEASTAAAHVHSPPAAPSEVNDA